MQRILGWAMVILAVLSGLACSASNSGGGGGGDGGGGGSGKGTVTNAAPALSFALSDLSAAEMSSGNGEVASALRPSPATELLAVSALLSVQDPFFMFLNPARARIRGEVRRVVEAPLAATRYLLDNQGSIACLSVIISGTCPPDATTASSSCTRTLTFTGPGATCEVDVAAGSTILRLVFGGQLDLVSTVATADPGGVLTHAAVNATLTATGFAVQNLDLDLGLIFQGALQADYDGTTLVSSGYYTVSVNSDSSSNPMTATDLLGNQLSDDGLRTVTVTGSKLDSVLDANPVFRSAGGIVQNLSVEETRSVITSGSGFSDAIQTALINLDTGAYLGRTGTLTGLRLDALTVSLSGSETVTDPFRTYQVTLDNVVVSLTHVAPVSGSALITFSDTSLTITLIFTGACTVPYKTNRGGSGSLNYCDLEET